MAELTYLLDDSVIDVFITDIQIGTVFFSIKISIKMSIKMSIKISIKTSIKISINISIKISIKTSIKIAVIKWQTKHCQIEENGTNFGKKTNLSIWTRFSPQALR